jgi:hypothetical protein
MRALATAAFRLPLSACGLLRAQIPKTGRPLPPLRGKVSAEGRRMRGRAVRRVVVTAAIRANLCSISEETPVHAEAVRLPARPLICHASHDTFPRKGGRGARLDEAYLSDRQREMDLCAYPSPRGEEGRRPRRRPTGSHSTCKRSPA